MTDLQAALGLSQMARLDEFVASRHLLARRYDEKLDGLPVVTPRQHRDSYSGLHLYVIRLKLAESTRSHRQVFEALRAEEIGVNLHYIPVYRQPYYEGLGFKAGYCPQAELYYAEAISLPLYPDLSLSEQDKVLEVLTGVVLS